MTTITIAEQEQQPSPTSTTTPPKPICTCLSNCQSHKRIKAILKSDPIMDGSGHLYLKDPFKPLDGEIDAICDRTIHAFRNLAEVGEVNDERARLYIKTVLEMVFRPRRGKPMPKPQPKPRPRQPQPTNKHTNNKPKPQKPQPRRQNSTRRQEEVRVITVTIVKKRGFHYPLDLPAGAAGDEL